MDVDEVIWEYSNNTGKTNGMFETYMLNIHYYASKLVAYEIQATHICVRHADSKETNNIGRIQKLC